METLITCPPWLNKSAEMLLQQARQQRLHHALLVTGAQGIGKQLFCQWLVQALLCETATVQSACGECAPCRQLMADAHPDFRAIGPEGAGAGIRVDRIREMVTWLQLTAGPDSYRIALISQADTLNQAAANSLLKTLEEPADNALLILCADRIGALPATVRSRCQTLTLSNDNTEAALQWLSAHTADPKAALLQARGAPLKALQLQDAEYQSLKKTLLRAWQELFLHQGSVGRIADALSTLDTKACLAHFSSWCVLAAQHNAQVPLQADDDVLGAIAQTHQCLSHRQWFILYERLLELYRTDSAGLKTQTVLEGLFADIRRACQKERGAL